MWMIWGYPHFRNPPIYAILFCHCLTFSTSGCLEDVSEIQGICWSVMVHLACFTCESSVRSVSPAESLTTGDTVPKNSQKQASFFEERNHFWLDDSILIHQPSLCTISRTNSFFFFKRLSIICRSRPHSRGLLGPSKNTNRSKKGTKPNIWVSWFDKLISRLWT